MKTSISSFLTVSGVVIGLLSSPAGAVSLSAPHSISSNTSIIKVALDDKKTENARDFVQSMAQRGIGFLANPDLSMEQRAAEFEKLLETSFDMDTIAKFALGRYWRTTTGNQRKEYLKLFKGMLVQVYSMRFSDYDGQDFVVNGVRTQGERDAVVTSYIIPIEGPKIEVEWRVRYNDGQYKVIDVIVEGVSMGVTQRADFSSVIQRGGGKVDVLLDHLREAK